MVVPSPSERQVISAMVSRRDFPPWVWSRAAPAARVTISRSAALRALAVDDACLLVAEGAGAGGCAE